MDVTLVVRSGDDAGRRIAVPAGGPLRVGRGAPADVRLPADPMLSNPHFSVEWDDTGCRLRDLGSRFGVTVNGRKAAEALLADGDVIEAGRTAFAVEIVGGPPPADGPAGVPDMALTPPPSPGLPPVPPPAESAAGGELSPLYAAVLTHLRGQPLPLYGLLDAARENSIPARLKRSGLDHQSLYDGQKGEEIAGFGPWLVRLPPGAALLEELVREGWGRSWGVFLTCELELAEVRRHLRRFLIVKLPDGRQVYFRFYDPRVLRTYLPTCTPDEVAAFVGPVKRYLAECPDGSVVLEFAAAHREWGKVPLAATVPAG